MKLVNSRVNICSNVIIIGNFQYFILKKLYNFNIDLILINLNIFGVNN